MQGHGHSLSQTIRAVEWWEYKLSPPFATIYATAFLLGIPILSLWRLLLLALIALIPGAAYVSVINDLTDLKDDVASGKGNRLNGRSKAFVALLLMGCVLPGIFVSIHWRNDPLVLFLYLAAWLAFSLYSLPPARLKKRGVLGILADASGAHLFPTLLVVTLVVHGTGNPIDLVWFCAVAVWSLSSGLRGILWHQLSDLHNDEKIGLRTFALRHQGLALQRLGNFIVFPAEILAFAVMLGYARSYFAFGFLFIYVLFVWLRRKRRQVVLVIVVPKTRYRIAMHEYYEVFYPLAFLLSSSLQHPADAFIIIAHLLLFPRRARQLLKDLFQVLGIS